MKTIDFESYKTFNEGGSESKGSGGGFKSEKPTINPVLNKFGDSDMIAVRIHGLAWRIETSEVSDFF